jgi:cytochrome c-type biogenesis protein CcmH/NrfG
VGATLVVVFVIVPPVRAQRALEAARALRGTAPLSPLEGGPVEAAYRRAARLDPWDPTPLVEWSEYLAAVAALPVSEGRRFALRESAIEALERGMARDPDSVGLRRMGARLRLEQARLRPDASTCRAAEDAARATIDRYPQDPRGWVVLAEALLTTGESLSDPERCAEAAKYLEHARRLDQRRHNYAQEVRSLTAGEQRRIAAYLERAEQCAASNP